MKRNSQEEWDKGIANQEGDAYGLACFDYAEKWADLMEPHVEAGEDFSTFAEEASHKANVGIGVSGFMHSMAALILAKSWVHGEAFRLWFNIHEQIGDEGERANEKGTILNTAILNISV